MIGFAFRNLLHRKTRTAISVTAIAAQFAFVLLLIGLCVGTLEEVGERIENIGSDIIKNKPRETAALLRTVKGLSAEEVARLSRDAEKSRGK